MPGFIAHTPMPPAPEHSEVERVTLQAFHALGRFLHLHRQAMQRLSKPGAHHGEFMSLRLLATSEGMSQRDLAETLYLSRPRVTRILQGLEKAGAVRREVDPDDQRITRVFLTAEGRRQELETRAAFEDFINGTIGRLSDQGKLELTRLLDELSSYTVDMVCPGAPDHETRAAS